MTGFAGINWVNYAFIDFGCSNGGSLRYCMKRFGAERGLGIDLDETKVQKTRLLGLDAVHASVLELPQKTVVRFVAMMDVLEHLPSLAHVEAAIAVGASVATDFLFIRHPSFEGEAYLSELGFAQYWWNWSGHTTHAHVSDYCRIFARLGLHQYHIHYHEEIVDTTHASILPANTPRNLHHYDPERDPPKRFIQFREPLWRSQDIFVALRPFAPGEWATVVRPQDGAPASR